jgi:phytoene/squalene synthetase
MRAAVCNLIAGEAYACNDLVGDHYQSEDLNSYLYSVSVVLINLVTRLLCVLPKEERSDMIVIDFLPAVVVFLVFPPDHS